MSTFTITQQNRSDLEQTPLGRLALARIEELEGSVSGQIGSPPVGATILMSELIELMFIPAGKRLLDEVVDQNARIAEAVKLLEQTDLAEESTAVSQALRLLRGG